jgi:hypothetical protein
MSKKIRLVLTLALLVIATSTASFSQATFDGPDTPPMCAPGDTNCKPII